MLYRLHYISIHAPSRERPKAQQKHADVADISIHAPSRERRIVRILLFPLFLFQSTLPRGSDSIWVFHVVGLFGFQSTLPRGSDVSVNIFFGHVNISIHAPSRERQHYAQILCVSNYFNPRSLAGATLICQRYFLTFSKFQSTLPRGSD